MRNAPNPTTGRPATPRDPEAPKPLRRPEATKEEVSKLTRNAVLLLLALGSVLPVKQAIHEWQFNAQFRAKGYKYDKSTGNYVHPDEWHRATPNEPLVNLGWKYRTKFYDERFGYKCMVKERCEEQVRNIFECFKEQEGRYPTTSHCVRSNETQQKTRSQHDALEQKDGDRRPANRAGTSSHEIDGCAVDIGTGPNGEKDYGLIRPCAEKFGYRGGFCVDEDPYHIVPGKQCGGVVNQASWGWRNSSVRQKIKSWRSK